MVELDGVLWTIYRPFVPCSGLSGAVDVEGQAVLRNGEDFNFFIEAKSAVDHFLYILKAHWGIEAGISHTFPGLWWEWS